MEIYLITINTQNKPFPNVNNKPGIILKMLNLQHDS